MFLLKDHSGKALLIAQAANRAEADDYGRTHLPDFSGESLELDDASRSRAEEFWGVRTVQVGGLQSGATVVKAKTETKAKAKRPVITMTHVWVRGLEIPEGLIEEDVLTPEDRRDLALDHIARTSNYIGRVEIRKWARL